MYTVRAQSPKGEIDSIINNVKSWFDMPDWILLTKEDGGLILLSAHNHLKIEIEEATE